VYDLQTEFEENSKRRKKDLEIAYKEI
jgi:hypothetical protein